MPGAPTPQAIGGVSAETEPAPHWPPKVRGNPIPLTLTPMPEQKPSLQFALLPRAEETTKGNAAIKYLTATQSIPQLKGNEAAYFLDEARTRAPLAELNEQDPQIQEIVNTYSTTLAFRWLHDGARLDHSDWGTSTREQGLRTVLPSLGGLRHLANVLQFQIRLDIKHHDYAAARDKLCTGYSLALHLGEGDTLIESLVGIAVAANMTSAIEDWVAQPDAPNLYWPLTNLPAPFNDLRHPLQMEMGTVYFSFPEFRELQAGHFSVDNWNRLMAQIAQAATLVGSDPGILPTPGEPDWKKQLTSTGFALVLFPQAKDYLARRGTPRETIDKMPVPEVLGRYFLLSFQEEQDDAMKWAGLPAAQASAGMASWEKDFAKRGAAGQVNFLARILLPSLSRAETLAARVDRQIAMLRIVEALRMYAADNGKLPASLDDLTLPIPSDPTTGKPFTYSLTNGAAKLISEHADKIDRFEYAITLRK